MSVETTGSPAQQPIPSGVFKGSDLPPLITDDPPNVIIVGAGIAGLFLGSLLEEAGIPYQIFERVAKIKPLGSVMALSSNVFPVMEQTKIYEDLLKASKPARLMGFYTGDMKTIAQIDATDSEITGYDRLLFSRPELYNILFNKIPPHKIQMSKKVLSFQQNHEGVMVRFNDNTTTHGDILVGADGAHSSVRQHLYKTLVQQDLLPKSDSKNMNKGYISLLGTTEPLDPANYPGLDGPAALASTMIGDNSVPYTWVLYSVPGNKFCWNVVVQLELTEIEEDQFRSSDYAPETNQKMLDEIRHFKTPYGTMGDIFDMTPKDQISKVYFEDKLFETWHHGRTILIGDAAHKLLPSTGQGAVNAIQDAVVLANCLYDLKPTCFENIKAALTDFKEQRFDYVKAQYAGSQFQARLKYGHTFTERIMRHVMFNWIPESVRVKQMTKESAYRPQVNFLPQTPQRGVVHVISQKPSRRVQEEEEAKKAASTVAAI
ncbi:hypothetical protein BGX29_002271 [Mortierella sp. GBA35]|nr:hypothetical protein BGX29_002271 [Mortierella sp. GBA35]